MLDTEGNEPSNQREKTRGGFRGGGRQEMTQLNKQNPEWTNTKKCRTIKQSVKNSHSGMKALKVRWRPGKAWKSTNELQSAGEGRSGSIKRNKNSSKLKRHQQQQMVTAGTFFSSELELRLLFNLRFGLLKNSFKITLSLKIIQNHFKIYLRFLFPVFRSKLKRGFPPDRNPPLEGTQRLLISKLLHFGCFFPQRVINKHQPCFSQCFQVYSTLCY